MIRRLRRTRRVDVAAFALALFVAGWVTAQLRPAGESKVSPTVYAEPLATLRFSHAKHAGQSCTSCHGAAVTSRRATDNLRPPMSACVDCHNREEAAPDVSKCGTCHTGMVHEASTPVTKPEDWRSVRPAPMMPPQPQAALRFDHASHVPRLGGEQSCQNCHGTSGEPTMPSMQSCNSCHDGESAPSSCTTCHPTGADGKLRGKLRGRQGIDEPLRPNNHGAEFIKRHGSVAKSSMQECMSCHVEQDCATCHVSQVAQPFAVHPPNFLTVHAVDARMNAGNCTDCHTTQTFCTSCHVRADVTVERPNAPPPRRNFHPPGWLDSTAANNHGVMARRDINDCASCHSERDCITCHAGVNPHPPEFSMSCRRMLTANSSACAKCHDDLATLRALCP